jgi:hypothetical protein
LGFRGYASGHDARVPAALTGPRERLDDL